MARTDEPRTPVQVATLVRLSDVTVRAVLHRWNAAGMSGLTDGRRGNGSEPKLTARRVAHRSNGRIDRLRSILRSRLAYLARNPETVQPFIRFHWTRCLER